MRTESAPSLIAIISCLLFSLLLLSCGDRKEAQVQPTNEETQTIYNGTIIAAGDSLTEGLGVREQEAWPALLAQKLQDSGRHWQVINAGISGETSSGLLARITWILARKPDIVILETGANDGLRGIPPSLIRKNIGKAVQLLQDANVTVVLAGMQITQNLGPDYTKEFAALYPAVADERNCLLIPFLLQDVATEPALNQADTIHPNKKGHQIIADTVYPHVLQALQIHLDKE